MEPKDKAAKVLKKAVKMVTGPRYPAEIKRILSDLSRCLKLKADGRHVRVLFDGSVGFPKGVKVGRTTVGLGQIRSDLCGADMETMAAYAKSGRV